MKGENFFLTTIWITWNICAKLQLVPKYLGVDGIISLVYFTILLALIVKLFIQYFKKELAVIFECSSFLCISRSLIWNINSYFLSLLGFQLIQLKNQKFQLKSQELLEYKKNATSAMGAKFIFIIFLNQSTLFYVIQSIWLLDYICFQKCFVIF